MLNQFFQKEARTLKSIFFKIFNYFKIIFLLKHNIGYNALLKKCSRCIKKLWINIFCYLIMTIIHILYSVWHWWDQVLKGLQDVFSCLYKSAIFLVSFISDFISFSSLKHRFSIGLRSVELGGHSYFPYKLTKCKVLMQGKLIAVAYTLRTYFSGRTL